VLPRGQSAASLAPLPVSLLPLPGKLLANLERGQCDRCGGSGESLAQRVGAGWRALSVGAAIAADTGWRAPITHGMGGAIWLYGEVLTMAYGEEPLPHSFVPDHAGRDRAIAVRCAL